MACRNIPLSRNRLSSGIACIRLTETSIHCENQNEDFMNFFFEKEDYNFKGSTTPNPLINKMETVPIND
ncbi:hypothetical protein TNIN_312991 [Trichonephila inaurata madagascariensis]|uniref:Uncharacterized protein n=1 Tax=Trichonephila inaurata madagascariensis TaxID=2747483 RepID=A0A8X6X5D7_9ARAC|nr:hypothetical protein TNIN_312991 [Trichonephila inaurata madagascariensis]